MNGKPDYGNWVPKKLLALLWGAAAVSTCLLAANLLLFKVKLLTVLLAILSAVFLLYALYMQILHRSFSFEGGNLMSKIHGFVLSRLPWDGKGSLLDIGCGSGALTIRAAKKFPKGTFTGLDYWGVEWDYAKEMCEKNAQLEGVPGIEFIKGDATALPFEDGTFDAAVSNFVFHEVRTCKDKRQLVKEGIRVVKKGGCFAFHDLFEKKSLYGDMKSLIAELKAEGVSQIYYEPHTEDQSFIPGYVSNPLMLYNLGILYGVK